MDFKLSFRLSSPAKRLNYKQPVLLTGSCFSDHIANNLKQHCFNVASQPGGVVFNPISIAHQLLRIIDKRYYTEAELAFNNELWHSWQHHSSFSNPDKNAVLTAINAELDNATNFINADDALLIVTLGSALIYTLNDSEKTMVANCHKYPQHQFTKRFLQVEEIVKSFSQVIEKNNHRTIYFTVSPVRHIKDGLVENNVSKSILLQTVHELCNAHTNCYYFPAYEIVMDELRDYRFYNQDMIHPNAQAVEYVWQCFTETCMDKATQVYVEEIKELNRMMQHKPLHPDTASHLKFEEAKNNKRKELEVKYGLVYGSD